MLADNLEVDGDLLIGGENTRGCCAHWPFTAVDPSMNSVINGQNEKYVTETKAFFFLNIVERGQMPIFNAYTIQQYTTPH